MAGDTYGVGERARGDSVPAPELPYRPREARAYSPAIGLVGCGEITAMHLAAYRAAGYRVTALCNPTRAKAEARRAEFYPDADVFTDHRELLATDVEVVDVATHVDVRPRLVEDALLAGKHVLSQKPFVLDLDEGERLVALADELGLRLAVNQNGRWAPHFAWMRAALERGLIGELESVDASVHWDHSWTASTRFDEMEHLVLFDFGIHWFDMVASFFAGREALRITARSARTGSQKNQRPMLAHAHVEYEGGRATLAFHGASPHLARDETVAVGSAGALVASGPDLQHQSVALHRPEGVARPALEGEWFGAGFHGTMAELLCAIEEEREPVHSARDNLEGLALCFAACASAADSVPRVPGAERGVREG